MFFSGISGSRVRFLQAMLFCHVELGGVIRHAQVNFQGCSRCSLKKKGLNHGLETMHDMFFRHSYFLPGDRLNRVKGLKAKVWKSPCTWLKRRSRDVSRAKVFKLYVCFLYSTI